MLTGSVIKHFDLTLASHSPAVYPVGCLAGRYPFARPFCSLVFDFSHDVWIWSFALVWVLRGALLWTTIPLKQQHSSGDSDTAGSTVIPQKSNNRKTQQESNRFFHCLVPPLPPLQFSPEKVCLVLRVFISINQHCGVADLARNAECQRACQMVRVLQGVKSF